MKAKDTLTRQQRYQLLLALLATVGGIVTVLIGILTYRAEQQNVRDAQKEELKARVWEQRLVTYGRVSRDVATIAIHCEADPDKESERFQKFQSANYNFRQAYWGDMSLIEDKTVEIAMMIYMEAVKKWEDRNKERTNTELSPKVLRNLSYLLAHVFRKSLRNTWNPEGAFDPYLVITNPLQNMYNTALRADLDVKGYQKQVMELDK